MRTYDLVEMIKARESLQGCSDRSFALKFGLNYQSVLDWKSGKANASLANFLKLARLAGMSMEETEEFANAMEKRKNYKEAGFADVGLMAGLSAMSFIFVTGNGSTLALALSAIPLHCILC